MSDYLTLDQLLENAETELQESDVEGVFGGGKVRIRELSAHAGARVHQGNVKLVKGNPEVDIAAVQKAKFLAGVIEPSFTREQVDKLHRKSGASFSKVVAAIDALSGLDEDSEKETEAAFQD